MAIALPGDFLRADRGEPLGIEAVDRGIGHARL